jgi:hypothetical protein
VVDNCRRRSTFYVCICSFFFLSYCVLETHINISMSSLLHFYRTRSATTINQLKPLQRIRSHSPDDVLHRQKVIYKSILLIYYYPYFFLIINFLLLLFQSNLFAKPVRITANDNKVSHLTREEKEEKKIIFFFLVFFFQ